jgi:small subunit ribosomal protein S6
LAETVYEGMFLLDSNRYGRDPEGVAGQIPKMIQEAGGAMLVSRLWEERRLAYPIKGRRKGTYWLTYFRLDGPKLGEVRRKCQLSDSILRALFVKIDPRIVDTLVEHAQTGDAKPARRRDAHGPPVITEPPAKPAEGEAATAAVEAPDGPAEEAKSD